MRHPIPRLIAVALVLVGCGASTPETRAVDPNLHHPHNLYPLADGNLWSYDIDTGTGVATLAITRVLDVIDTRVEVTSGGDPAVYEIRPEGIYRPPYDVWLLRAPIAEGARWESANGRTAVVTSVSESVETPGGAFENCVRVQEESVGDSPSIETVYCPGVGPVIVDTVVQLDLSEVPARTVATLRGYCFPATGEGVCIE